MPKHKTMDQYIQDAPQPVIPLLEELRAFINDTLPGATEGMKYGAPYFFNAHGVAVIYLFGTKDHVNFGFLRSSEVSDPDGLLKGSGDPSKHVEISPEEPVDTSMLRALIKQCEGMKPNS